MSIVFRRGDRVQLTEHALARGLKPKGERGTVCRSPNPTALCVRVVWDSYGCRSGLYCSRGLLRKVDGKEAGGVHRKAGTWFDDAEIYEWFAKNLHRVRHPSLRHYVRARELKAARMDWTDVLAVEPENRRARLAAELLDSPAHGSTAERVKSFVEQGGGCRATFFNYRRYLLK